MTFPTPTSKENMYSILQDIFYYYRIQREADTGVNLAPLVLQRMTYTDMTAQELRAKAEKNVQAAQQKKLSEYKKALSDEIFELNQKVNSYTALSVSAKQATRAAYAETRRKAERDATKRGIAQSSAVIDRLTYIDTEMTAALTAIDQDYGEKTAAAQAKIARLNYDLSEAENFFGTTFDCEVIAEEVRLKDEEDKLKREIFKYNNGLDEKELRHANGVITTTRSLELRYMNVASNFFTKDQLVEMGYYRDAISCVTAYYNTLESLAAYRDISADTKVPVYLDDYYPNILYMYRTRAGL
ncbi:MAG: hypothetical protein IJU83_01060 [Clostridia bacterium]|nr:hypothetical protein [Clostridia bacterium]